jgi:hypothetical protein
LPFLCRRGDHLAYARVSSRYLPDVPDRLNASRDSGTRGCNLDDLGHGLRLGPDIILLRRLVEEDLLFGTMRRFVREGVPRPTSSVILLSTVRELEFSMKDELHNAITIVRERLRSSEATKVVVPIKEDIIARLAQSLIFVQKTQLQTKNIGRRVYLSILGDKR